MKNRILLLIIITWGLFGHASESSQNRVLCYDRFDKTIWEMTGEMYDDPTCRGMATHGAIGMCFEGEAQAVKGLINEGLLDFSPYQRVVPGTAEVISKDILKFTTYEGDFVPWTREGEEMFRCPEFDLIPEALEALAMELKTSSDMAVTERYRREIGLPAWVSEDK